MSNQRETHETINIALPVGFYEALQRLSGQSGQAPSEIAQGALKHYLKHDRGVNAVYLSAP